MKYRQGFTVRIVNGGVGPIAERCSYGGYAHAVIKDYFRPSTSEYVKSVCFAQIFAASLTGTWSPASKKACPECRRIIEHRG